MTTLKNLRETAETLHATNCSTFTDEQLKALPNDLATVAKSRGMYGITGIIKYSDTTKKFYSCTERCGALFALL